ncbi:OLC1v1038797C1 [Oldenlandia corymbosa var. corymbosa]|uniref:OLC1v1038797C1 n=1 Tax=Oldenlandia corymbosa var. corymbosa TaxID=529605 RepID=A0AAV1D0L7_OLDCO|nr:OLC1v1038797C1 [Oldenlandia corymbosa var. corymbosa]
MVQLSSITRKITNHDQLKQLHAQLVKNSLHHGNYWAAQLICLCKRLHAPPLYTRRIFESAHFPNVVVFTNMLKYYSKLGNPMDVSSLFGLMQKANVKPDSFVYPLLIKSSGKAGIAFHAHLLKLGRSHEKFIDNAIMSWYGKYGPVESAWNVFDQMSVKIVADWNSIISACWNWGKTSKAVSLFGLMPEKNVISWTAMVSGSAKAKDLEAARRYFDQMPERSIVSWNAMISGYAQNGQAEEAIQLYNEMLSSGLRPDETTCVAVISSCSMRGDRALADSLVMMMNKNRISPNHFVKTALLDIYAKCGDLKMAREMFDDLGVYGNLVTWNAMIAAYTRVGDLTSAMELFQNMLEKDVISWNTMIAGCLQNGESAVAIDLFKEMITCKDIKPDEVTMVGVISACGHLGALEMGNWVVKFLSEKQIKLKIGGHNSLIFMYSKCGSMTHAYKVFQEMDIRDVISYNTLIAGFAAYGSGVEALEVFSKMQKEDIEPDRITYISVLTACSHSGLLEEGKQVFDSIVDPDIDHYACMVDLYCRVGRLDEAKRLIDVMPMDPHAGIYGSLLNASRVHTRIDLGEFAASKLFELEPENSGNYVLLSNIYARAGRWEDVDRIRGSMKKGGVKKTTGWSWVEHDGELHRFIVGDQSHERSVEMHRVLAELKKKMKVSGYIADKDCALRDVEEEEKEEMVGTHSEKLAVAFALLVSEPGTTIRVVKNLRICRDCHDAMKIISQLESREIMVRDNNRFHSFKDGVCSCKDHW